MKRPWWIWLRPIVRKLCHPEIPFAGFRWWRRLWGGHWERWYVDSFHCELWMLNAHGTRPGACFGRPICEDYSMPLNPRQVEAVVALDWLLDPGNRREGRSLAMAVALIRRALANPNVPIAYLDHFGAASETQSNRLRQLCRDYVSNLIRNDPTLLRHGWRILEREFTFVGLPLQQPIHGWWPSDDALGDDRLLLQPEVPAQEPPLVEEAPVERPTAWDRLNSDD